MSVEAAESEIGAINTALERIKRSVEGAFDGKGRTGARAGGLFGAGGCQCSGDLFAGIVDAPPGFHPPYDPQVASAYPSCPTSTTTSPLHPRPSTRRGV